MAGAAFAQTTDKNKDPKKDGKKDRLG